MLNDRKRKPDCRVPAERDRPVLFRRADACAPFGFGFRRIFPPKCFAFLRRISKMDAEVIPGLLDSTRKATSEYREYGKGKTSSRMDEEMV